MASQHEISLRSADELASSSRANASFQLPVAISARIDQLVEALEVVESEGQGRTVKQRATSRKELVAALVLAAGPEEARQAVRAYRQATVGQALIGLGAQRVVRMPVSGPGLRPTSDQKTARRRGQSAARRRRSSSLGEEARSA